MKKVIFYFILLVAFSTPVFSQSVGIGTTTPDASSVLELKSTNKGFLPPRMTAAEKTAVAAPKQGLLIYQTDGAAGLYVYSGTAWEPVAASGPGAGWAVNGNSGTNPASNFIGTRDNQSLKFRVNNIASGEINVLNANAGFGQYTLEANTTGTQNTALGYNTLTKNTTGSNNTAIGVGGLYSNITGARNTAVGLTALALNSTGNDNVGVGNEALNSSKTGSRNVAIGNNASFKNVDGDEIVAVGDSALYNNTASGNMAIGSRALLRNTNGVSNTAVGFQSLYYNTTGSQNTSLGRIALFANTTGIQNTAAGNQAARYNQNGNANTVLGFQSLFLNVAGNNNTAIGRSALSSNTASDNTAVGYSALQDNSGGFANTAIGREALYNNVSGNYNTAIGYQAATFGTNYINATAIGANAQAGCSNCVVLGSTNGYNGATANSRIGIGTTSPQKTLHVNPNGAGGMMIGQDMATGGYTYMNMGISAGSGGYSFIQSVKAAWPNATYGALVLNQSGGNVGIRTANPLATLHLKQYEDVYPIIDAGLRIERHDNSNHWDMGMDFADDISYSFNGAAKFYFHSDDGELYTVSDKRMKKDIQSTGNALPLLMKLEPKKYHYLGNSEKSVLAYGFIAQDVEQFFPDAVSTKGADGKKAISYQKINILAIKAIQEQQQTIETQQKELNTLKQQQALLSEQIAALQKMVTDIKK